MTEHKHLPKLFNECPLPWTRGSSTSDGDLIYDANQRLVMVIRCAVPHTDLDAPLQQLIVDAANSHQNTTQDSTGTTD